MSENNGQSLLEKLAHAIFISSHIFAFAGVVMFATMCWIISIHFRQLGHHIQLAVQQSHKMPENLLKRWKDDYYILLESISLVQNCFGPVLFVWITFVFVTFISNSFFLVDAIGRSGFNGDQTWLYLFFLTRSSVNLLILSIFPVILQKEV